MEKRKIMMNNMRVQHILLTTLLIMALISSPTSPTSLKDNVEAKAKTKKKTYKVVKVIDGDTIVVKRKKKKFKVRLLGVNAPESVHPDTGKNDKCGERASKFTKKKLLGKKVTLKYDKDKYDRFGRHLAFVYVKKKMFNKTLLRAGHAKVMYFKPNKKYKKQFLELEFNAKTEGKGLWKYETPSGSHSCTFVGVLSTMKFHKSSCGYLANTAKENQVDFDVRADAINSGYAACLVCKP